MDFEKVLSKEWCDFLPHHAELLTPIKAKLDGERAVGVTILPKSSNIFRMFHDMKPEQVRVLLLGQDVYNTPITQPTGRAFECGAHPSPTWRKMMEVYKQEVTNTSDAVIHGNLQKWVDQGVFLLNKALTVRYKMPNSHTKLWEPFTHYVIGQLLNTFDPKAVILLGSEAQRMMPRSAAPHKLFSYEHPAAATYQQRAWEGKGMFKEVKAFLEFHGKTIEW